MQNTITNNDYVYDLDGNLVQPDSLGYPTFYKKTYLNELDDSDIRTASPTYTKYDLAQIRKVLNCSIRELARVPQGGTTIIPPPPPPIRPPGRGTPPGLPPGGGRDPGGIPPIVVPPNGRPEIPQITPGDDKTSGYDPITSGLFDKAGEYNIADLIYGDFSEFTTNNGIGGPDFFGDPSDPGTDTNGFGNNFGGTFTINFTPISPGENEPPVDVVVDNSAYTEQIQKFEELTNDIRDIETQIEECTAQLKLDACFAGQWMESKPYTKNSIVYYLGSYWLALADTTGVKPLNMDGQPVKVGGRWVVIPTENENWRRISYWREDGQDYIDDPDIDVESLVTLCENSVEIQLNELEDLTDLLQSLIKCRDKLMRDILKLDNDITDMAKNYTEVMLQITNLSMEEAALGLRTTAVNEEPPPPGSPGSAFDANGIPIKDERTTETPGA